MGETSPKLLDFMSGKTKGMQHGSSSSRSCCDENKLELKLGLPSQEDWQNKQHQQGFILRPNNSNFNNNGVVGVVNGVGGGGRIGYQTCVNNGKVELSVMGKDTSQPCYTRIVNLQQNAQNTLTANNTAVPNTSQKRAAPSPVVGWPPIRSFRKNLASSSSGKTGGEPQTVNPKPVNEKKPSEHCNKGLFVKINMDGVPIGRKVDLNACNCYENLSSSVDTLFRGLLTALKDTSADEIEKKQDEQKPITGLLDGTGEYTLVYEDNEGDRMLVGDVPWHMFVSTVKRLRVLKTSDLPTLSRCNKKDKAMVERASK